MTKKKTAFVIPADGRKVAHPQRGRAINPDGETVELNSFINRRIADGDLIVGKPQPTKSKIKGEK